MRHLKSLFIIFVVSLLTLSLSACDGEIKDKKNENRIDIGEYSLVYKGASIMKDYDGKDVLIANFDFINNSDANSNYVLSVYETVTQNETILEEVFVYKSEGIFESYTDSQFEEVKPGSSIDINISYALIDTTSKVNIKFEETKECKTATMEIDLTKLEIVNNNQ